MARYIDADALKERLLAISVVSDDLYGMGINRGLDRAETAIDMLPTAEVVEVVRCKDCVWWEARTYGSTIGRCENPKNGLDTEYLEDDNFCSYGERGKT